MINRLPNSVKENLSKNLSYDSIIKLLEQCNRTQKLPEHEQNMYVYTFKDIYIDSSFFMLDLFEEYPDVMGDILVEILIKSNKRKYIISAMRCLAFFRSEKAEKHIFKKLGYRSEVGNQAVKLISRYYNEGALNRLLKASKSDSWIVRYNTVKILSNINTEYSKILLEKMKNDKSSKIRDLVRDLTSCESI